MREGPDASRPGAGGAHSRAGLYRCVRRLARALVALFYRRVEVVGLSHLPERGPVLLAANHQNALVDPILLIAAVPRRLRPLAKAPLFRLPILGSLLRAIGAIPVRRRQDDSAAVENSAMFEAAGRGLGEGGAILIFPEGVSQPEPTLMPLRTGAARILLAAPPDTRLVPVGLVYHEPGAFRAGWALVFTGPPVPIEDCLAIAAVESERAVRTLTARLEGALRALIVEAGDRETLRLMTVAEHIWRADRTGPAEALAARAEWYRQVARAHRYLAGRAPERLAGLRAAVDRYARDVRAAGLSLEAVTEAPSASAVTRYVAREGLALGLGLPLALVGILFNALPYRLTGAAVRAARPEPDVEATYKVLGGIAIYPLCWILEAGLAWRLGGGGALAAFLVTLVPASLLALGWSDRLARVRRESSSVLRLLVHRDLRRHLLERRRAIARDLSRMVGEVPDSVLSADPERAR